MGRPHVEFVQSQRLPWERGRLSRVRGAVATRLLSRDPADGACSLLVEYPAGFTCEGGALCADDEFLVLGGALEIDGQRHGELAYAHLPAGYTTREWAAPQGAVVLEFFSREPARLTAPVAHDPRRLVRHLDGFTVPYTGNFHPEFPPGAGRKLLYSDPLTQDASWLLGTLPMRWAERAETHPVVEEMYLLAGEVHGDRGVMRISGGRRAWRTGLTARRPATCISSARAVAGCRPPMSTRRGRSSGARPMRWCCRPNTKGRAARSRAAPRVGECRGSVAVARLAPGRPLARWALRGRASRRGPLRLGSRRGSVVRGPRLR